MIRTALRLLRDANVAGEPLAKAEYSLSHVYYATGRPDDSLDHLRIGQQVSHGYDWLLHWKVSVWVSANPNRTPVLC